MTQNVYSFSKGLKNWMNDSSGASVPKTSWTLPNSICSRVPAPSSSFFLFCMVQYLQQLQHLIVFQYLLILLSQSQPTNMCFSKDNKKKKQIFWLLKLCGRHVDVSGNTWCVSGQKKHQICHRSLPAHHSVMTGQTQHQTRWVCLTLVASAFSSVKRCHLTFATVQLDPREDQSRNQTMTTRLAVKLHWSPCRWPERSLENRNQRSSDHPGCPDNAATVWTKHHTLKQKKRLKAENENNNGTLD